MSPNNFSSPEIAIARQLQIGPQLSHNYGTNIGENTIFATSVGPQEPFTVAKIKIELKFAR